MHPVLRYLLAVVFILTSSIAFSATEDDIQKALEQKKSSDNLKFDLPSSSGSSRDGATINSSASDLKTLLENRELPDADSRQELPSQTKAKTSVLLKIVPGDGLLKLSWRLSNYQQKPEDGQLRFIVSYGTESGKLINTKEVGTIDSFTIRELKNYQPYYLQVSAYHSKKRENRFTSSEETATPLPTDEQGSKIESAFSRKNLTMLDKSDAEPLNRELTQFGYEFFKNSSPFLNALDNMPASGTYALGPGDTLNIVSWGSLSAKHELVIDRNGEITIPKVGVVNVSGLTYDQAKEVIYKAVSRYYKNFELNVSLGKIRTIQIFAVGEVANPGTIPVSSLSTLINALSAAGGPSRNGSLRNIKLLRDGKVVSEIDLYEMFLSGDRSKDVRLQNGDTIFVPVIGPVVAVAGEVKRPAIYELREKTSLTEVIKMAGGITATGDTGRIQVERVANRKSKVALDFQPVEGIQDPSLNSVEIMDRDMIKVFPKTESIRDVVVLRGNVVRPGEYQYKKGMRLKDVISSFSDLLPESYLDSAEITRLSLPDYNKEILSVNIRKALNGSEADNIELREQDTIKVFSRWEMQEKPTVEINGYVIKPGTFGFYPGMTVRDLVSAAGSTKRNAILDFAELTRVVIEGDKARSTRMPLNLNKALNGDPTDNIVLQPDDVLIVRGISDWNLATDKFVTLKGEVRFPGIYSITRGEKLSSVIERAGGYTDKAYPYAAKFTRKSAKELQQKRMDEVIARTEKDIMQKQFSLMYVSSSKEELEGTRAALDGLMKGLERVRALKAEGRIVIRLSGLEELKKSNFDLVLEGGDMLEIPRQPNTVSVMGFVYNQTTFVYQPESADVDSYLAKAGGPTREAETSDMYIIKADGSVFSRQQSSFGMKWSDDAKKWSFGGFMSTPINPGDTLVVPQRIERTAWLRDIKDITTILSQIALTAGTILIGLR
jgi:protein involved in polysaccharide export with SLBB domain